jgi:putative MATE family efflux protein
MKPGTRGQNALLSDPVGRTLLRLAGPMVYGLAAIILFQVVDTFFVAMLGDRELAAMSFTFPVGYAVMSIAMGLGLATTAVIGQAIGYGDAQRARRLTTHALLLAVIVVTLVGGLGLLVTDPLFVGLLRTPDGLMPLVHQYMDVFFSTIGFLVIPMVGNSALRATGDTKTPSIIMVVAGGANIILDPLLIFGWGPVPSLGLFGAALATALSWMITFCWALYVLHARERLLVWEWPQARGLLRSWKRILKIGLPAVGANLMIPVAQMLLTRMVASYGALAVAAFGVGTRIESVAMIGVFAMSTALNPFVAQNFGAGQHARIRESLSFVAKFSVIHGVVLAVLLGLLAAPVASLFSDTAVVAERAAEYLRFVPWSYGALSVGVIVGTLLNALSRANAAALLTGVRLFALILPLSYFGSVWWGFEGLLGGLACGNLLVGLVSWLYARRAVALVPVPAEVSVSASGDLALGPAVPPVH